MLFNYKAIDQHNTSREGVVEATNVDSAISRVQKEGYTIIAIDPVDEKKSIFDIEFNWFNRVSNKEIVILSRQISTLFDAQVSALRIFRLLASEAENSNFYWHNTKRYADDLQTLQNEQGVNVHRTPDSVMQAQLDAWDIVVDRISGEDAFFAKVIESQKVYAENVMGYLNLNLPDYKLAYKHYFG